DACLRSAGWQSDNLHRSLPHEERSVPTARNNAVETMVGTPLRVLAHPTGAVVGWVERSETHHTLHISRMDFASAQPILLPSSAMPSLPRKVKTLAARRRAVGEGLLRVPGRRPDVVAHDVEQLPHLDMGFPEIVGDRERERAVGARTVERGLAMLGRIDH